jgi:hypothetical protein
LDNGLHFLDKRKRASASVISGKRRVTAIEPHLPTALADDDAEAIMLDLDQI